MIRNTLSTRNNWRAYVSFRIITITLKNSTGEECGTVAYVRLGSNEDTLDNIIFECIKQRYQLSIKEVKMDYTSTPTENFMHYDSSERLFISVKNSVRKDYGYEDDTIDSMLAIHLDVYNPTDAFLYNELQMYSRISQNEISSAANEIEHNLDTYNNFIR